MAGQLRGLRPIGGLVDGNQFVNVRGTAETLMGSWLRRDESQFLGQRRVERVVDQRTLAASRNAAHPDQGSERELRGDLLQVVGGDALQFQPLRRFRLSSDRWNGDVAGAAEKLTGDAFFVGCDIRRRPLADDFAAVLTRARSDVDQEIGGPHGGFVMFDNDDGVSLPLQLPHALNQPVMVSRVQADRRLVKHVADADQSAADAGGKTDALKLAAAEGVGGPIKRQVTDPGPAAGTRASWRPRVQWVRQPLHGDWKAPQPIAAPIQPLPRGASRSTCRWTVR